MISEIKGCAIETFQNLREQGRCPILYHQINAQGVMGSGIALHIKNKYPKHYKDYIKACSEKPPNELLGTIIQTPLRGSPNTVGFVVGLFGQLNFGRDKNTVYTDYSMLKQAFEWSSPLCETVVVPKYIGCGLANGDWEKVMEILKYIDEKYKTTMYIVEKV